MSFVNTVNITILKSKLWVNFPNYTSNKLGSFLSHCEKSQNSVRTQQQLAEGMQSLKKKKFKNPL